MNPEVAALYARIPKIDCRGKCQEYCGAIVQLGAYTEAEGPEIERAMRDAEIGRAAEASPLVCCALDRYGRCTIYSVRPAICRFWGVVEGMLCPHGCEPERVLSQAEMNEILKALAAIAGPGRFAEAKKSFAKHGPAEVMQHLLESSFHDSRES